MTDMPPPYPGINGYNGYNNSYANASAPPQTGFNIPPQAPNSKHFSVFTFSDFGELWWTILAIMFSIFSSKI